MDGGSHDFLACCVAFVVDICSECGQLVVLFLGPVFEWVVVTLCAADLGAEEDLDGVADVI